MGYEKDRITAKELTQKERDELSEYNIIPPTVDMWNEIKKLRSKKMIKKLSKKVNRVLQKG